MAKSDPLSLFYMGGVRVAYCQLVSRFESLRLTKSDTSSASNSMRSIQRLCYHIYIYIWVGWMGQPRTHSCHHHYLLIPPPPSHLVPYLARPFGSFMFLGVNFAVEGVPCTPSTWDCPSIPKVDPLARYKPTLGTWAKKKIFAEPEPKRVRNPIGHLYDHLEIEGILLHQSIALSILDSMHLVLTLNS